MLNASCGKITKEKPALTMNNYDTIIIGGGMAGLGCARTLSDNGYNDFLMITKDIGGRIVTSTDGKVNYGAYYVRSDYKNVLPYFKKTKRISPNQICYWAKDKIWTLRRIIVAHPILCLRFFILLMRFNRQYQKWKRLEVNLQQSDIAEYFPLLKKLYTTKAHDYFEQHGFGPIMKLFVDPLVRLTVFGNSSEVNAAVLLGCSLVFFHRTYEFKFLPQKLIEPFKELIKIDEVTSVSKVEDVWEIKTASGQILNSKHLVSAAPTDVTKVLLSLKGEFNAPLSSYFTHIRGELLAKFGKKDFIALPTDCDDMVVGRQQDGTFIFYSSIENSDFSKYFSSYEVIAKIHWKPAMFVGNIFRENDIGRNAYVIGDHNICGLEDSYITGIYAANQILKNNKK